MQQNVTQAARHEDPHAPVVCWRSKAKAPADKAVKTAKSKEVVKKMGHVKLDGNQVKNVDNVHRFKYLGSLMTPSGDSMAEVDYRRRRSSTCCLLCGRMRVWAGYSVS